MQDPDGHVLPFGQETENESPRAVARPAGSRYVAADVTSTVLPFDMEPQPNDSSCGPTCLKAVYGFYGDPISLDDVIAQVQPLDTGGTLAVHLASHALRRGYAATIYTYNLDLFDPTWFAGGVDLRAKLSAQLEVKGGAKMGEATQAYLEFLELGGVAKYEDLSTRLLSRYIRRGVPLLTGLSATYLYRCAREDGDDELEPDDVRGVPTGHFVVLCGYDSEARRITVADPWRERGAESHTYEVSVERVVGAIMLGVLTYDANLLVIEPKGSS